MTNKLQSQITTWEYLGGISFALFSTGFVIYVAGCLCNLYYYQKDPNTNEPYTYFEIPLLWLLIIIPFIIQIYIFCKFFIISRKDQELNEFFKIYNRVMCFGLFSYSLLWLIYNLIPKSWGFFSIECKSYILAIFSILSLAIIGILIWIVILCTRVVIRKNFIEGKYLLNSTNLNSEQYKTLCNKLNAVLELQDIEDALSPDALNEKNLKEILTSDSKDIQNEQKQISKIIVNLDANLTNVTIPLKEDDSDLNKIIDKLLDRDQPTQIKPLKRILYFLQDDNLSIHNAIINKDFLSVPKHMLIKALNKILMEPNFFDKTTFDTLGKTQTPVKSASDYFKNNEGEYFFNKVQLENRNLLDAHILKFLNRNPSAIHDSTQEIPQTETKHPTLNRIGDFSLNFFKLGLTDHKELKIKEGIVRFPFSMLSFFLTIFICIIYLFAFAFAFHDQSILVNDQKATPALFMANDYLSRNSSIYNSLKKGDSADESTTNNEDTNENSNNSTKKNINDLEKPYTFFIFYESSSAGLDITLPENLTEKLPAEQQEHCEKLDTEFQEKLFNKDYNLEETELKEFRKSANIVSFCYLLRETREKAPTSKKTYIEIVGRANDASMGNSNLESRPQQTYSANYELSLARAQSLKFELVRQLQASPNILEKIEWSFLPVSNDPSLGGDYPLNNSTSRPLTVNNSRPLNPSEKDEFVEMITDNLTQFIQPDINKTQEQRKKLLNKKKYLEKQSKKAKLLFDDKKIGGKESGDALFSSLQKERVYYETLADESMHDKLKPDTEKYASIEKKFDQQQKKIGAALFYFDQNLENANKRTSEIYITSIPETKNPISRIELNLIDYILYSITKTGYGDIKPTTIYAKFLSTLINIVEIFFIVVFFNALLSVKRVNEEDEVFNLVQE